MNSKDNPNIKPQLCAIFAKSSGNWRNVIRKAFFADNLVDDSGDPALSAQLEQARIQHIKQFLPGVSAENVVKFALFDRRTSTYPQHLFTPREVLPLTGPCRIVAFTGQLVLPDGIASQFSAKCVEVPPGTQAPPAIPNTRAFPEFSYFGNANSPDNLRQEWSILSENGQLPDNCHLATNAR